MNRSFINWLKGKTYFFSEIEILALYRNAKLEAREEVEKEYTDKIEDLKMIVQEKSDYIFKSDMDYSILIVKADKLEAKLNEKDTSLKLDKTLASEIFKEQ